jgi:hypothetical protein
MAAHVVANSLWAMAKLGVADESVIMMLALAGCDLAGKMNVHFAANSLWGIATLGETDEGVIKELALSYCIFLLGNTTHQNESFLVSV